MPIHKTSPNPKVRLLKHRVVAITTVANQVILTSNAQTIEITNIGTADGYIGGSGVTTTSYSRILYPSQNKDFGLVSSGFNFYVICASGLTTTLGIGEDA